MNNNEGKYSWVPAPHMVLSVSDYIEHGKEPGCFLQAVLKNDLRGAAENADTINRELLFHWVSSLYSHAPWKCWGSEAAYEAWVAKGGIKGGAA